MFFFRLPSRLQQSDETSAASHLSSSSARHADDDFAGEDNEDDDTVSLQPARLSKSQKQKLRQKLKLEQQRNRQNRGSADEGGEDENGDQQQDETDEQDKVLPKPGAQLVGVTAKGERKCARALFFTFCCCSLCERALAILNSIIFLSGSVLLLTYSLCAFACARKIRCVCGLESCSRYLALPPFCFSFYFSPCVCRLHHAAAVVSARAPHAVRVGALRLCQIFVGAAGGVFVDGHACVGGT